MVCQDIIPYTRNAVEVFFLLSIGSNSLQWLLFSAVWDVSFVVSLKFILSFFFYSSFFCITICLHVMPYTIYGVNSFFLSYY